MIIVLLVLGALGYAFCAFWGLLIGGIWAWRDLRREKREREFQLLQRMQPIGEKDLEGWNGATELEIDEEI